MDVLISSQIKCPGLGYDTDFECFKIQIDINHKLE